MFCLTMAAGMLIWGQTVLEPLLKGIPFLMFWAACFLFTIAAIIIALQDIPHAARRHQVSLDPGETAGVIRAAIAQPSCRTTPDRRKYRQEGLNHDELRFFVGSGGRVG